MVGKHAGVPAALLVLAVSLTYWPVRGAQPTPPDATAKPPAVTVPAVTVQVSRRDCRRMVHAVTRDDVRFKSGVDVRGKPVAPADLRPRTRFQLPDTIVIPITVDLCERVDLTTGRKLCRDLVPTPFTPVERERFGAEAQVGTVVARNGGREIYFNGQPLHDQEAVLIREACEHFLKSER
jgi:hypothetical protein